MTWPRVSAPLTQMHWSPSGPLHQRRQARLRLSHSEMARQPRWSMAHPSRSKQRLPARAAAVPHRRERSLCNPRAPVPRPATSRVSVRPHSLPSGTSGIATIASPNVPGGTYGVTARYSGDGKYYSSTSNSLNVTVTPEPSQMQMGGLAGGYYIETPLTVSYGEPVPLWVAVGGNSGYGHPSGQINLLVDGNPASITTRDYSERRAR